MNDVILLYFPYQLNQNGGGSSLRPKMMINAFEKYCTEKNYDLFVISGESSERKKLFRLFRENYDPSKVICCYSEGQQKPIWLNDNDKVPRNIFFETKFFKYLKRYSIPVGYFYRDMYWKFDEYYPIKSPIKDIMRVLYNIELKFLKKYLTILYLPSLSMNDSLKFSGRIKSLPPGLIKRDYKSAKEKKNIVYVGSLMEKGSVDLILSLANYIKHNKLDIEINLNFPKRDLVKFESKVQQLMKTGKVNISHYYGEELRKVYDDSCISLIPRSINEYFNFSVPVKLFEYISYYKPILTTNCIETSNIVKNNGLGEIIDNRPQKIIEKYQKIMDEGNYDEYQKNMSIFITKNTWYSRVNQIVHDLVN